MYSDCGVMWITNDFRLKRNKGIGALCLDLAYVMALFKPHMLNSRYLI